MRCHKPRNWICQLLEQWLWDAACVVRGPLDAPKFKDYILPLIFLKRLSDVFEDEVAGLAEEYGDEATALSLVEKDHKLGAWDFVFKNLMGRGRLPDRLELSHAGRAESASPATGSIAIHKQEQEDLMEAAFAD